MSTSVHQKRGKVEHVIHEPGNMTRYEVITCEFKRGQWAVTVPYWNAGFFVLAGADLRYSYIREKCPQVRSDADASEIAKAIAASVPGCKVIGTIDETGNPIKKRKG